MSTFLLRVEDLVGSVSDNTLVSDSLTDAAAEIINLLPAELLWAASAPTAKQTTNGYVLNSARILQVFRERGVSDEFVVCEVVGLGFERNLQDINSLFYPSINYPKVNLKNGAVYVYPAPLALNAYKIIYVKYPTVSSRDSVINATSVEGVTVTKANPAVFSKTAHGFTPGQEVLLHDFTEMTELNGITAIIKTVPTADSFTLTGINSTNYGAAETTGGVVERTDGAFPDGLEFAVVLGAALKCSIRLMSDVLGNIPSAITLPTAPTAPAAPVYSYTDATGTSIAATAIGSFGTAPNYTAPVTTPDFSTFNTKVGTNDYEEARVIREKIDSQIAEYSSDIQNQLNDLNEQNLEYQGKIQDEITQAQLTQQKLTEEARITTDVDKQNKLQDLAKQVQQYQSSLGLYQNDIQEYGARAGALIQDYSSKVQRFLSEYASRIQSYPLLLERYNSALKPLIGDSNGR